MPPKTSNNIPQIERVMMFIVIGLITGFLMTFLYALQAANLARFASVFAVALIIAGAALLSGGLLGFLFGIPRTLQQNNLEPPQNGPGENGAANRQQEISYQMNTNLEQISDWLTKILVGVGLTQLASLPEALQSFANFTAAGLGNFTSSGVFSIALLIYYLICGFLISYLWTRSYLAGAFREADLAAIGGMLARVENKVSELEKQVEIDAKALSVVQRQLNPPPDGNPISQEEINALIKPASPSVKSQIFYLAQAMRSENWQDRENKPKMERTIPIFRALIADDVDDIYYANHGQLGFALKDQRNPDWVEAERELTKAIELRGQENVWLFYEFNRAICRINLDERFKQGEATDESTKNNILADLKEAAQAPNLLDLLVDDPNIKKWMGLNKVTRKDIT